MVSTRAALVFFILALLIPVLVNLFTSDSVFSSVVDWTLSRSTTFPNWTLVAVGALAIAVLNHLIFESRTRLKRQTDEARVDMEKLKAEHKRVIEDLNDQISRTTREKDAELLFRDQQVKRLTQKLDDATQLTYIDTITGISNEKKWKADIKRLAAEASIETPIQVALIDLIGFGRLNDELGYPQVDRILEYLAQTLDVTLRKNEGLYKRKLIDDGLLADRIYRKYPGGDEFYVVARGTEADMLGLLARLQDYISRTIDGHVSREIANREVKLRFQGAVCRLRRDEEPEEIMGRLIDYLRRVRYPDAPRRLIWETGKLSKDFVDARDIQAYERAQTIFATTKDLGLATRPF